MGYRVGIVIRWLWYGVVGLVLALVSGGAAAWLMAELGLTASEPVEALPDQRLKPVEFIKAQQVEASWLNGLPPPEYIVAPVSPLPLPGCMRALKDDNLATAIVLDALNLLNSGQTAAAIERLTATSIATADWLSTLVLAQAYVKARRRDDALTVLERFIANNKETLDAIQGAQQTGKRVQTNISESYILGTLHIYYTAGTLRLESGRYDADLWWYLRRPIAFAKQLSAHYGYFGGGGSAVSGAYSLPAPGCRRGGAPSFTTQNLYNNLILAYINPDLFQYDSNYFPLRNQRLAEVKRSYEASIQTHPLYGIIKDYAARQHIPDHLAMAVSNLERLLYETPRPSSSLLSYNAALLIDTLISQNVDDRLAPALKQQRDELIANSWRTTATEDDPQLRRYLLALNLRIDDGDGTAVLNAIPPDHWDAEIQGIARDLQRARQARDRYTGDDPLNYLAAQRSQAAAMSSGRGSLWLTALGEDLAQAAEQVTQNTDNLAERERWQQLAAQLRKSGELLGNNLLAALPPWLVPAVLGLCTFLLWFWRWVPVIERQADAAADLFRSDYQIEGHCLHTCQQQNQRRAAARKS